jgi:hypothetical protein
MVQVIGCFAVDSKLMVHRLLSVDKLIVLQQLDGSSFKQPVIIKSFADMSLLQSYNVRV